MSLTLITENKKEPEGVLVKNMTARKLRDRIGIESHETFWKWLDAMTDEEWTDSNGTMCRPVKIGKRYSFFTPNQIVCIYKRFGIKPPRID